MKFITTIALLLLGTTAVMGAVSQTTITDSSFIQAPQVVVNPSEEKEGLFSGAYVDTVFFSPADTSETLYVWTINWNFETQATKSIIRRAIDASTLEAKGEDVTLDIQIKSKVGVMGQAGIGYLGFPSIRDDGEDTPNQLYFSLLVANATSDDQPTDVKITENTDKNTSYFFNNVWFADNAFWMFYTDFDMGTGDEKTLYIQAIKTDGTLMYDAPVKVATLDNPAGTTVPIAGPNKDKDASTIYVVYKDYETKTTMQTTMSISNGQVDEPTQLVTDTDTVVYYPDGMITAAEVSGVVLLRQEFEEDDNELEEDLKVYYNGATSKPETLDIEAPEDYQSPVIQSGTYQDGFSVVVKFYGQQDVEYVVKAFKTDGSELLDQKTLLKSQGNVAFFQDAAGALWAAIVDYDFGTGKLSKGYLGKVLE